MIRLFFACLLLATLAPASGHAADWQWSIEMKGRTPTAPAGMSRAFLWIPPDAPVVRAVIVAQQSVAAKTLLEHPRLRATLRELGFAVVLFSPSFDLEYQIRPDTNTPVEDVLHDLALESGYSELAYAPVIPFGHAAAAAFPWNFARRHPAHTLAVISISGQWPYGDNVPTPETIDPALNGIPGLVMLGEYEWANERAATGLAQRAVHPGIPLTFVGEAAGGHFETSYDKIGYIALYLRKAAEHRLPPESGRRHESPVTLRYIDPLAGGWLVDRWRGDEPARVPAAPLEEYAEPDEAFWCFDAEHAVATEKYRRRERGKRAALLGFLQDGAIVPQIPGDHAQVVIPFRPHADGLSFELGATFLNRVPQGRPERWTGLPAGAALARPEQGGPIMIETVSGPVVKRGEGNFAVEFDRHSPAGAFGSDEIWLVATHPGDAGHKASVQQAVIRLPIRNEAGAPQRIAFPAIPDQRRGARSLRLGATSDAATKVGYYVREGPAEILGDTLTFTAIPTRARLPIRVTVVAWQYGRTSEPRLQSATPVERTFLIHP